MNYSTAVFLISEDARCIACSYEKPKTGETAKTYHFKSFDSTLKVGDLVVVPTSTRHSLTVVRVEEVDVEPDLQTPTEYKWIVGKVDISQHEDTLAKEAEAIDVIKKAQKRKQREELRKDLLADAESDLKQLPIYTVQDSEPKLIANTGPTTKAD